MRTTQSFAQRLNGRIIRVVAALFAVTLVLVVLSSYSIIYKDSIKEGEAALDVGILNVEKLLTAVENSCGSASWLLAQNHQDPGMLAYIAENIVKADSNIVACSIGFEPYEVDDYSDRYCHTSFVDDKGKVSSRILGGADYDYHCMDWYIIPKLLDKPFWSDPMLASDGSGRMVTSYSRPLYHDDGSLIGVVKCDIDLVWLNRILAGIKPKPNSELSIVGHNAFILNSSDIAESNMSVYIYADQTGDKGTFELAEGVMSGKRGITRFNMGRDKAVALYGPINNGWVAVMINPYRDIFGRLNMALFAFIALALISLMMLSVTCRRVIRRFTQPITEFVYAALSIGQGNFKAKIPEATSSDELIRLHDSLHYMEDSIDRYITELRATTASNERFESELNIANNIQMSMLLHEFPQIPGVDVFAFLVPAKEVGGDLYDCYVKNDKLYFAVGDVSGKGVPAALYMAITRAALRIVADIEQSLDKVADRINNAVCQGNKTNMFVTMFIGCLDLHTLQLDYCNCGHNPIVTVRPDGTASYLKAKPNIAVGLFENFKFQQESLQLEQGSRLVIYTDGVTEAEQESKAQYGEDRLITFIGNENPAAGSEKYISDLIKSVRTFTGNNPQNDDITIMSIYVQKDQIAS